VALIYYAIPFFFATLGLERWLVYRKERADGVDTKLAGFTTKDSFASLAMGVGFLVVDGALKLLPFAGLAWLHQFRLFDIHPVWWSWVLLLIAEDFCGRRTSIITRALTTTSPLHCGSRGRRRSPAFSSGFPSPCSAFQ
jgi:hypothetical protein